MRLFSLSVCAAGCLGLLQTSPMQASPLDETAGRRASLVEKVRQLQAELQKVNHDLLLAHSELAVKAERITELEERVQKLSYSTGEAASGEEVFLTALNDITMAGQEPVSLVRRDGEREGRGGARSRVVEKIQKEPETDNILIFHYDRQTAVNYEGRDEAVRWLKGFDIHGGDKIEITAHANDTAYETTNREIARNRANFLAAYLRQQGVPRDSIVSVTGHAAMEQGESGRRVEILIQPESSQGGGEGR